MVFFSLKNQSNVRKLGEASIKLLKRFAVFFFVPRLRTVSLKKIEFSLFIPTGNDQKAAGFLGKQKKILAWNLFFKTFEFFQYFYKFPNFQ